jgi:hypothetical protein
MEFETTRDMINFIKENRRCLNKPFYCRGFVVTYFYYFISQFKYHVLNKEFFELCFSEGADLNRKSNGGSRMTPFMLLCFRFDTHQFNREILEMCLKEGGDLNMKDSEKTTAFYYLCLHSTSAYFDQEIIKICVKRKGNLNIKNEDGMSPFDVLVDEFENNISFNPIETLVFCYIKGGIFTSEKKKSKKMNKFIDLREYVKKVDKKNKYMNEKEKYILFNLRFIFKKKT